MKKYIIKRLKEKLEEAHNAWADNYISKKYNESLETDEAKKNVAKNELNMRVIEDNINNIKKQLDEESKK